VRRTAVALAVLVSAAFAWAGTANAAQKQAGDVIPGRYIVTVKDGSDPASVAKGRTADTRQVYRQAINGFSAKLSAAQVAKLKSMKRVATVEPDRVYTANATQNMDANGDPWGLDRIDQRNLPLSGTYTYNSSGSGVTAYVIDTGIATSHSDFGGRASNVYDALGGNGQDCNGHGTHVAGTIGGSTYGVAKSVALRGVRVLGCDGSGSTSGIISALNWVASNAQKPAVANMSLGGGYSASLNSAATNLANSGVFLAVAAGNESQDACNVSPASAPGTYTVAASDRSDLRAYFSNFGGCVDGYAPGVDIKSAWLSGGTNTISGTSMASPHVAGVGALYKSANGDAASSTIVNWVNSNATSGAIGANIGGTPNRLLYKAGL
jgi:subtilisin family serine protease